MFIIQARPQVGPRCRAWNDNCIDTLIHLVNRFIRGRANTECGNAQIMGSSSTTYQIPWPQFMLDLMATFSSLSLFSNSYSLVDALIRFS
jgi:hypothetical protein